MRSEIPQGKGVWIWKIWELEGSSIDRIQYDAIVETALEAGLSHVYIKVADGYVPYNVRWQDFSRWSGPILEDYAAELAVRLQNVGMMVLGWQYVRGIRPTDEADTAITRITEAGLDGYAIDAEHEYKQPGKAVAARAYSQALRDAFPELPISLASYRYPRLHPELPWGRFLEVCDFITQQLYWEGAHNPGQQLERSLLQNNDLMEQLGLERLPQCPIGAGYGTPAWQSTAEDLRAFFTGSLAAELPSASVWSWDWMRKPAHLPLGLWEVVADLEWEGELGPTGPREVSLEQWANEIDSWARARGYEGPKPLST